MLQLDRYELMRLFAEVLAVDPRSLSEDSSPDNVEGWDSAKSMELIVSLEEALSIEFTASEIGEMVSIGITKEILIGRGILIQ